MAAYQKNTGMAHPLSGGIKLSRKRGTTSDPLTDDSNVLWYGTIAVGTPPKSFTGMTFLSAIS
jgi:cathepsin D